MTFTTSLDDIVRKKTVSSFLAFTVITLMNIPPNGERWVWRTGLFFLFMLMLLYTYLRKPIQYLVDDDKIIIRRPIGNVQINIHDIVRVDRIRHDLLKDSRKGGAFGYFGKFDTFLGRIQFYATRRDRLVMLTKKDQSKIILTPDQEDVFIESVEAKAGIS